MKLAILLATMDTTPPLKIIDNEPTAIESRELPVAAVKNSIGTNTDKPKPIREITENPPYNYYPPERINNEELIENIQKMLDEYYKKFKKEIDGRKDEKDEKDERNGKNRKPPGPGQLPGQQTGQQIGQPQGQQTGQPQGQQTGQPPGPGQLEKPRKPSNEQNPNDVVYDKDGNEIPIAVPVNNNSKIIYTTESDVIYDKNDISLVDQSFDESKLKINDYVGANDKRILPSYSSKNIVNIMSIDPKSQEIFRPPNNINIDIKDK
jgi:hypothetical protein